MTHKYLFCPPNEAADRAHERAELVAEQMRLIEFHPNNVCVGITFKPSGMFDLPPECNYCKTLTGDTHAIWKLQLALKKDQQKDQLEI